jgi:poly(A) polymerase
VGGAVRDLIIGKEVKDYDFVLEQRSPSFLEQLGELFEASYFSMGQSRQELVYRLVKLNKTLDFCIMTGNNIHDDLMRRDFTINAIAYSFDDRKFYASSRAWYDLQHGTIDLCSPQAIEMDPLRMLRAVREECTLPGFRLSDAVKAVVRQHTMLLYAVASERVRAELDAIVVSRDGAHGLRLLHDLGLLRVIMPELAPLQGLAQGRHHAEDALSHTLSVVEQVNELASTANDLDFTPDTEEQIILAYSALLHDIGKPQARQVDETGEIHFYGHPAQSALLADSIMRRLKFPNRRRDTVLLLVRHHMRVLTLAVGRPRDAAVRRLIHDLGAATKSLLTLGLAELMAKGARGVPERDHYLALCRRIIDLYEREDLVAPPPLVAGDDLLAIGYRPGPELGAVLKEIRKKQIEGVLRTKEEAMRFVRDAYPV